MGTLFTLDDDVKSIISAGLDDLITELGKTCKLVYPVTKWTACNNCVYDPVGQHSSNRWVSGGPLPFPNGGTCPQCNGKGLCPIITTENVVFLCNWEARTFTTPIKGVDLRSPDGLLETKGFLTDLPKVERCDHLLYQINVVSGGRAYKLFGEPADRSNIIQGRYFFAVWQRAG